MIVKQRSALLTAALLIGACASPYQVAEDTDKFSDPSSPRIYSFKGNGIDSGGPLWTLPVSGLNPWVAVDRTTGKAIAAGFNYRRAKPDVQFGPVGPARWLNVRPGDEIVFLADGERIALRAASARIDHTVYRTTGIYYFDFVNYRARGVTRVTSRILTGTCGRSRGILSGSFRSEA